VKQADEPAKLKERFTSDLQIAKKFMDPIHQKMDKYYEQYRNRWSDYDTKFQVSDLYSYTETVVPILTNNRVRSSVHSDYPDYVQHAQGMADILDNTYDINNWDYESQNVARMAEIYRSSMAYTGFDGDYKNGTGRLCIKSINIRWCYLDPGAVKLEDSSFFFYVEPMRKSKVVKMYPAKKKEIEDALGKSSALSNGTGKSNNWFTSWVNKFKNALSFTNDYTKANRLEEIVTLPELTEEEKHRNSVAFIHHWYRDDNDKWRVSFWADDVFLEDKDNPFWHERLPYDIYNPTKDILSSVGIPMAEHIENLNIEKNVMMQYIIDNAHLHANPPLMYNTTGGNIKDPQSLREQAKGTGVIPINNPDMVPLNAIAEYMNPPGMPNSALDLPDRLAQFEDRLTGVNDSFRGMSDATSGKEVQLKQEAAYTRIKTKIDNFELFNKCIAEKIIVNAMQFYKETRAFRIKGDYSKYNNIIQAQDQQAQPVQPGQQSQPEPPFAVKPIQTGTGPDGQPVNNKKEFYMYANPNEWTKINPSIGDEQETDGEDTPDQQDVEKAYKILQFTVEIEAGSSLPQSRMARREEAMELANAQMLDQEAVLDAYDWPHRDEIIKRMGEAAQAQQKAQADAQMQQQQQQAQAQMRMKQMELEQQAKLKQMELQNKTDTTAMNNNAKQQTAQQPKQGLAEILDEIRKKYPEAANMSDQELLSAVGQ
jgi:hypothetical protein